jgi:hypothetical protein
VYELLTKVEDVPMDAVSGLIGHRHVPLKVSIFDWRLLRNRLPTKVNLVARGMLGSDAQLCVSGCGEVETAHHLFVSCPIFGKLWCLVRAWVGVNGADPFYVPDHFLQFTNLAGVAASRRSFMQMLWLICVRVLWNARNNKQFNNTDIYIHQMLEKVKINSYWWLKAANAVHVLGVHI